jgi:sugar phosphate isomerase/epimerase
VYSINDIWDAERQGEAERRALLEDAEWICSAAEVLGSPTVQVLISTGLAGKPMAEIVELTARNLRAIADIGKRHSVRFKLEPFAWSPLGSLSKMLRLVDETGRDNVGLSIDFWHLFAGEETTPDEVAQLPSSLIFGVHFGDGLRNEAGTEWDEDSLRGFLAGEGKIPIQEWVDAVRATGYDGTWSYELVSRKHWESDIADVARECKELMLRYL